MHATARYEMQGAMSVAVPLPFPTIAGAWEWRTGGEAEERRNVNNSEAREGGRRSAIWPPLGPEVALWELEGGLIG
jgi:hypothetical protein